MTKAKRAELLRLIRSGYPPPAARAKLNLTRAEVEAAGLEDEISEAMEVGQALLLAKATEQALNGDAGALRDVLNRSGGGTRRLEQELSRLGTGDMEKLVVQLPFDVRERLGNALGALGGAPLFALFREIGGGGPGGGDPWLTAAAGDELACDGEASGMTTPPAPASAAHGHDMRAEGQSGVDPGEFFEEMSAADKREELEQERAQVEKLCWSLRHRIDAGMDEAPGSALAPLEEQLTAAQQRWSALGAELAALELEAAA